LQPLSEAFGKGLAAAKTHCNLICHCAEGRSGVLDEFGIAVNKQEQIGIERSVEALKTAMNRLIAAINTRHSEKIKKG
jgi:hypothetical protein